MRNLAALLGCICLAVSPLAAETTRGLRPFTIPSESMLPTLEPGDWIWTTPVDYRDIVRGDVIVFHNPQADRNVFFVFRAIAFGGESVGMRDGIVKIDGVALPLEDIPDEVFDTRAFCPGEKLASADPPRCRLPLWREKLPNNVSYRIALPERRSAPALNMRLTLVPEDHLFLLGDNRANAADSRFPTVGAVPATRRFYRMTFRNFLETAD